jgi:phosphatidylglycerophosphate synthase
MNVAGVIFLLSMLLDRADGELARQTNQMSLAGHRYDLWCDCTVNAATFIAIGASFSAMDAGLGSIAGFAIVILFWQLNVVKVAAVRTFSFMKGYVNIDPDDAMVLVPILVWLDLARPMLLAAAIITPLVVLWIAFTASSSKSEINNSAGGR